MKSLNQVSVDYFFSPSILLKAPEYFGCGWWFVKPGFTCFAFYVKNVTFCLITEKKEHIPKIWGANDPQKLMK